jgi:hypothetical protein
MTARARVTQSDMARAVRAADVGRVPRTVEIAPDGTIRIVPVDGSAPVADHDPFLQGIANAAPTPKKSRRHAVA